jgi:hypothetical protein
VNLWRHRRPKRGCPSPEAEHAAAEAERASEDVDALTIKAEQVAEQLSATQRRNHFGDAVVRAIRGV